MESSLAKKIFSIAWEEVWLSRFSFCRDISELDSNTEKKNLHKYLQWQKNLWDLGNICFLKVLLWITCQNCMSHLSFVVSCEGTRRTICMICSHELSNMNYSRVAPCFPLHDMLIFYIWFQYISLRQLQISIAIAILRLLKAQYLNKCLILSYF